MNDHVLRSWLMLVLFIGMFLIVHGIYEEKLQAAKRDVKVEYRFIPRTLYEEQLAADGAGTLSNTFKTMFAGEDPMLDRRS